MYRMRSMYSNLKKILKYLIYIKEYLICSSMNKYIPDVSRKCKPFICHGSILYSINTI